MLFLCVCALSPSTAQAQGFGAAPVVVATAERRALAPVAWYPAKLIPRRQAQVSAEAAGRIEHIVEVGSVVEAQDEVARIDDTLAAQQLIEDEAEVASSQARLGYLDAEVRRLERLLGQQIETRSRLDAAIQDREVGRNELRAARARLDTTLERLARHRVRAPFAGKVVERSARTGEWAQNGQAMVHLIDTDSLEVQAYAPLAALELVSENDDLPIKGASFEALAKVRAIVPVAAEDRLGIYEVRLAIELPGLGIGQNVQVALPTALAREVVAIPRDALVVRRNGTSVFRIDDDNKAERVEVTTGIADGDLIEVDGIANGDRVVIRGSERLRSGQSVEVIDDSDKKEPPA
ncbi:MAG: efflux RND transporter periplasmic adaptor subunit [Ectothiorhodospiraceae bacterium AqS1]|nr:efflux RND transporter periplasmic adaptor subunit [Ectothiorhodospiraceae bacterium AqS1]